MVLNFRLYGAEAIEIKKYATDQRSEHVDTYLETYAHIRIYLKSLQRVTNQQ
jgi:hypothetical protein